jgi:hypothetical protein
MRITNTARWFATSPTVSTTLGLLRRGPPNATRSLQSRSPSSAIRAIKSQKET